MKELLFKFFLWKISVKVAKLPDESRISFLVHKLMSELEAQGHATGNGDGCYSLWVTSHKIDDKHFRIQNIGGGKTELKIKRWGK